MNETKIIDGIFEKLEPIVAETIMERIFELKIEAIYQAVAEEKAYLDEKRKEIAEREKFLEEAIKSIKSTSTYHVNSITVYFEVPLIMDEKVVELINREVRKRVNQIVTYSILAKQLGISYYLWDFQMLGNNIYNPTYKDLK